MQTQFNINPYQTAMLSGILNSLFFPLKIYKSLESLSFSILSQDLLQRLTERKETKNTASEEDLGRIEMSGFSNI